MPLLIRRLSAVVLMLGVACLPSAVSAQEIFGFNLGLDEDAEPPPSVELAREGPFEVICIDRRDREVTSYGPLFRVLRDNGSEARWQYEMPDGLTFVGRFDDWLTCEWRRSRRG